MPNLENILRSTFQLEDFREWQREVIECVTSGENTLVFMPTGGGKSLTYQLPGIAREGVAIIISPLISLMKDQVDKLDELGIRAKLINATISLEEQNEILRELRENSDESPIKFLYIAPERLNSTAFLRSLQGLKIALVAIDEAHCVSQWWHDFRPSYMRIRDFLVQLKQYSDFPTVALTATATKKVREDIVERLGLLKYKVFTKGFDRKNIIVLVREISMKAEKLKKTLEVIKSIAGSGIVYCSSRKMVGEVYDFLIAQGISAGMYTGAMDSTDRENTQNAFMNGSQKVIVATNAFGMGIDKKDIRFVIHYNLPGSIENYYQEIGRAGRDGKKSYAVVLASYGDTKIQEFFIENSHPEKKSILALYDALYSDFDLGEWQNVSIQKTQAAMAKEASLESPMQASSILKIFEKYGIVSKGFEGESEEGFRGRGITLALDKMPANKLPIDWNKQSLLEDEAHFKLEQIKKLLFFPSCRKRFILEYFDDKEDLATLGENCGVCDYCIEKDKFLSGADAILVHLSVFEIVLDAIEKFSGKFGGKTIADFLLGSTEAKLMARGMNHEKEYGVLREYSSALVLAVIDSLFQGDYIEKAPWLYPVLSCTQKGESSLRREEILKSEESELQSQVAMKIKGNIFKGAKKAKKSSKTSEKKAPARVSGETLDITLSLFRDGLDIKGIAKERDMSSVTIEGHLVTLFEDGRISSHEIFSLVDIENIAAVREVLTNDFPDGCEKLKPIKDRLDEMESRSVSYFEIKIAMVMEKLEKAD